MFGGNKLIVPHLDIVSPSDNIPLWRYMDFSKFVALLEKQSLYFCRGDILRNMDPYEGSYTKSELEFFDRQEQLLKKEFPLDQYDFNYSNNHSRDLSLGTTYINCWHRNDHESIAMWRVFISSNTGVAIKTDLNSLTQSFRLTEKEIYAASIQYIDHAEDNIRYIANTLVPLTRKNQSYEYEQEVRLMFMHFDSSPKYKEWIINGRRGFSVLPSEISGFDIPVDLNDLIHSIYIDPKADQWFIELVERVFNTYKAKHNLKITPKIVRSKLAFNDLESINI